MEVIFGIIVIVLIRVAFSMLLRYGASAAKSGVSALAGKGTFKENFELEVHGMGPLELRAVEKTVGEDGAKFKVLELEVKGLFPVSIPREGAFITSVFDTTDGQGKWKAVISSVHQFQEDESFCYQSRTNVGTMREQYGFPRWVRIGVVLPEVLQPPRSGHRKLSAVVRLIDVQEPPNITNGFHDDNSKILWSRIHEFELNYAERGYRDEIEGSREAAKAAVKLAVAVAMADGSLHDEEGLTIRNWIQKKLSTVEDSFRESWKNDLNAALKEGYDLASRGELSYSELTDTLSSKGTTAGNTECVDLLFAIIGADGEVNSNELALAKKIAAALNVDTEEVQRIADRSLVGVEAKISSSSELEDILGIDQSWSTDAIKKHLREQFQKWNNRLTSLSDPAERDNAQRMLTLIAEARQKYQ